MKESFVEIMFIFLANSILIIWFRTEAKEDLNYIDTRIDRSSDELKSQIKELSKKVHDLEKDRKK